MKAIEDLNWLFERMPNATEKQKDKFVEKVAICLVDGGMDEEKARQQVLAWMLLEKLAIPPAMGAFSDEDSRKILQAWMVGE